MNSASDDVQMSWLRSFVAVVTHGSFTSAARATYRSQPRVSAHIAALENAVGVRLLDRDTRGVSVTEAGSRFVRHARAALAEVRAGVESVESLAGQLQGRVVVGSFPGASGVLLAPVIKRFRERHGGVTVELHEGDPGWLEDAVADVRIDLAVRSADIPQRHPEVVSRTLRSERIVLVVRHDSPVALDPAPNMSAVDNSTFVVTGAPAEGWTDFTERLTSSGITPARIVTVAHPTTVTALVRAGLGIGLVGEMAATIAVFGDVTTRELPVSPWSRDIRIYWNSKRQLSTPAAAFLDAVAEAMSES